MIQRKKFTQKAFQDCSLRMNKIGDVLIAMYGATIGKFSNRGQGSHYKSSLLWLYSLFDL